MKFEIVKRKIAFHLFSSSCSISSTKFVVLGSLAIAARAVQSHWAGASYSTAATHTSVGADSSSDAAADSTPTDSSTQAATRAILRNIKHIIETIAAWRGLLVIAANAALRLPAAITCACYA